MANYCAVRTRTNQKIVSIWILISKQNVEEDKEKINIWVRSSKHAFNSSVIDLERYQEKVSLRAFLRLHYPPRSIFVKPTCSKNLINQVTR